MSRILLAVAAVMVLSAGVQAASHPAAANTTRQQATNTVGQAAHYGDSIPVCVSYGDTKKGSNKSWGCNY